MDSIIFDLDGTLWDSRDVVVNAFNEVLEGYTEVNKEITKQDLERTMGLQVQEIGRRLFPDVKPEVTEQIMQESCELECEYLAKQGGHLYDHVEDVLQKLAQKYKLFIVSNCQQGYIEAFYEYHQLDQYFLDFENPGRTGLSKGENIKLIIERNRLKNPVYVGDTEGDQKAAAFAGIPFVYARYGFGEVTSYDDSLDRFDQLLERF